MAALFHSVLLTLVSALYNQPTLAVQMTDMNRVLNTFNLSHDSCREVTNFSGREGTTTANLACVEAFQALDRLGLNSCVDWRNAACRFIGEAQHAQCTCESSYGNDYSTGNSLFTAFRKCASALRDQERNTGQTVALTTNLQEARSSYDNPWQGRSLWLALGHSGSYERTGSSSGVYYSGGAGSSRGVHTSGSASSTWDLFTSGFEDPSTPLPSYAPGTSVIKISEAGSTASKKLPKPHACDECPTRLRTGRALLAHKKTHHTPSGSHCDRCDLNYANRKGLLAHLRKRHPILAAEEMASRRIVSDPNLAEALLPHPCDFCVKRFGTRKGLISHRKSHTTDITKCPACGKIYSTKAILKTHLETVHPGTPLPKPVLEPNVLLCGDCGRPFKTKSGLRDHSKSHNTMETHCGYCDKILANKQGLKSHIKRKHSEFADVEEEAAIERLVREKPEECGACKKRFKNARGLQEHMPVHDGKTQCDECDAILPRKSSLSAHKKTQHPK